MEVTVVLYPRDWDRMGDPVLGVYATCELAHRAAWRAARESADETEWDSDAERQEQIDDDERRFMFERCAVITEPEAE